MCCRMLLDCLAYGGRKRKMLLRSQPLHLVVKTSRDPDFLGLPSPLVNLGPVQMHPLELLLKLLKELLLVHLAVNTHMPLWARDDSQGLPRSTFAANPPICWSFFFVKPTVIPIFLFLSLLFTLEHQHWPAKPWHESVSVFATNSFNFLESSPSACCHKNQERPWYLLC